MEEVTSLLVYTKSFLKAFLPLQVFRPRRRGCELTSERIVEGAYLLQALREGGVRCPARLSQHADMLGLELHARLRTAKEPSSETRTHPRIVRLHTEKPLAAC
ncbi:hypothetical protein [Streptomyces rhizosphaericus]|uniref:hypothetical protein n=1 Tax=Streptomyces rhizosphaericus TaxID=114699 RepID=UPI00117C6423|nr:hypothetical protein [Streptomyces rhizosphaericus]